MRNFRRLTLLLFVSLSVCGLIFGQKKTSKNTEKAAKPTIKTTQNTTQTTTPTLSPVVQDAVPQTEKTPTKKNERPTGVNSAGENTKTNSGAGSNNSAEPVYFYEFSQPDFLVSKIFIQHDEQGKGKITFLKKEYEEEISDPIQLTPAALERIKNAYRTLNFLDSTENYQYEKDYSHLGNTKFTVRKNGRERTAAFNWTENKDARALADEYRKIAQQFVWIFDMNLARENLPLNAPRLMDTLDSYIRRNEVSDAAQMIPFLKQVSNDERIPLIARNHATRLIKEIEKKSQKEEKQQ